MRATEINAAVFRILEKREATGTGDAQPEAAGTGGGGSDDLPF